MGRMTTLIAVIVLMLPGSAFGTSWRVPTQCATIHIAVDSCSPGDTILVAPGIYYEAIMLNPSYADHVTIIGEAGRDNTILEGQGVLMHSIGGCEIRGFTFNIALVSGEGLVDGVIAECDCRGIVFDGIGVRNTAIIGNCIHDAPSMSAGISGAVYSVIIEDNDIRNCTDSGIAISSLGPETSFIRNNTIVHNNAGGISIGGPVILEGNIIAENGGNGIHLYSFLEIMSNTIARNGLSGIRIDSQEMIGGDIHHNLIAKNGYAGILAQEGFNATFRCNNVWGNSNLPNGNYIGFIPDQTGLSGNISSDPFFCNAAADDYSLAWNSPALRASCGAMGAMAIPGCGNQTAIQQATWGSIKALYR